MANLEPRADKVVRDAVDAFMDGRLVPEFVGETVFETKNSRYRLIDGAIFSAPDASLLGAELVGWLCESPRRCLVESAWQPGSRAVLVDRRRGRNIIVTSTTRLLHAEEPGSSSYQPGSTKTHSEFRSWHPPPEAEPFPLRRAQIVPATPLPPIGVVPAPPPPADPGTSSSLTPSRPHLPPRPIATPMLLPASRPLPVPLTPPRREAPVAMGPQAAPYPAPPSALLAPLVPQIHLPPPPTAAEEPPEGWGITSAEMEIADPDTMSVEATTDDASHNATPSERPRSATLDGQEPVNSAPFPLVRPY